MISYVRDGGDWQVIARCAARFEDDCEMARGDQKYRTGNGYFVGMVV